MKYFNRALGIISMTLCVISVGFSQSKSLPYEGVKGWEETKDKRMKWFREARFGMFIHWGLYSAAGGSFQGEIYPQHYAEWIQTWGKIPSKQYQEVLKPLFTLKNFDPNYWAKLAKKAGMKYMILTSRHHEGFSLFNSQEPFALKNDVTGTANLSPKGRDLYKEIMEAFQQQGLKTGAYYSLLDWQHPDSYQAFQLNPNSSNYTPDHEKYKKYMHGQIKEITTKYGTLDVLWPDFSDKKLEGPSWGTKEILQDLIKWNPDIIVNNRFWNGLENRNGDIGTPEKYIPPTGLPGMDWEASYTMNESYGYSAHDENWKSFPSIMKSFIETVSKGGNFLLNVGPDGDGAIPGKAIDLLERIGDWMDVNKESIYGTTASPFQAFEWGYCTQKEGTLYLHVFERPADGFIFLPLKNKISAAVFLNNPKQPIKIQNIDSNPSIKIEEFNIEKGPVVIRLDIVGKPAVEETFTQSLADGRIVMTANNVKLTEPNSLKIIGAHTHDPHRPNAIGQWKNTNDQLYWDIKIQKPGQYKVLLNYLPSLKNAGVVELVSMGQTLEVNLLAKEGSFQDIEVGNLDVSQQIIGEPSVKVILKAKSIQGDSLPEIVSISLVPIN